MMNRSFFSSITSALLISSTALFAADTQTKKIIVEGSSTVYPIMEAMVEEFGKANPSVKIGVGVSGTGGGMKKFTLGEIDIANASRPMTSDEMALAKKNNISFIELPVAFDGIAVVTHPKNDKIQSLTMEELKNLWQAGSTVKTWADVRKGLPATPIAFFGPGPASGTYDYFSEAVVGKTKSIRKEYTASEDDNVLIRGIEGSPNSIGFFGYSYYQENKNKLKLIGIDSGKGPVLPSEKTILDSTYAKLSRTLFIYVNAKSAEKPEVKDFINYFYANASALIPQVGFVPLEKVVYGFAKLRFQNKILGSLMNDQANKNKDLKTVYMTK